LILGRFRRKIYLFIFSIIQGVLCLSLTPSYCALYSLHYLLNISYYINTFAKFSEKNWRSRQKKFQLMNLVQHGDLSKELQEVKEVQFSKGTNRDLFDVYLKLYLRPFLRSGHTLASILSYRLIFYYVWNT